MQRDFQISSRKAQRIVLRKYDNKSKVGGSSVGLVSPDQSVVALQNDTYLVRVVSVFSLFCFTHLEGFFFFCTGISSRN